MSGRPKTDREIMVMQLKEAEAFWSLQKNLIEQGVIDRRMISLAMFRLNELHKKALNQGLRDLVHKPIVESA